MGIFDFLKKKPIKNATYAKMMNGYTPIFQQFGSNIYASDVVQQAIDCIAKEMKKLSGQHINRIGVDFISLNSSIQNILSNPNPLMTEADFLEKITWQLYFNYNVFLYPMYRMVTDEKGIMHREYSAIYPIQPTQVDFMEDEYGTMYLEMRFPNGLEFTLPYQNMIHWRYRYSMSDYMGGNESGQPDNEALLETLELNNSILQGISKGLESSFAINGVVKYNMMVKPEIIEENIKKFEKNLEDSKSGILGLDVKSEYVPIARNVQLVDEATLRFVDQKILRHFGVPIPILSGDYTKEQYEAFYQKTLEPLILSLSQALTKGLFTEKQRAKGHEAMYMPKELIFMSMEQTLQMVDLLGQSGTLFENEKRVAFGLRPLKDLEGIKMQSLNWINSEYAKEYQLKGKQEGRTANGEEI